VKWIYIQVQGRCGLAAIMIPRWITVSELKLLLGLNRRSNLFIPSHFLPLPGEARLHQLVDDFETVYVELDNCPGV